MSDTKQKVIKFIFATLDADRNGFIDQLELGHYFTTKKIDIRNIAPNARLFVTTHGVDQKVSMDQFVDSLWKHPHHVMTMCDSDFIRSVLTDWDLKYQQLEEFIASKKTPVQPQLPSISTCGVSGSATASPARSSVSTVRMFLRDYSFHVAEFFDVVYPLKGPTSVLLFGGSVAIDQDLDEWSALSKKYCFRVGVGLPGRVAASGLPEGQGNISDRRRMCFYGQKWPAAWVCAPRVACP